MIWQQSELKDPPSIRLLVCGSRSWVDREKISFWIQQWASRALDQGTDLVVIHGAAVGADSIADDEARKRGVRVLAFPADWSKHGKSAGAIRNRLMLAEGRPTNGLAFGSLRKSDGRLTGTGDMVALMVESGLIVICVGHG